MMFSVIPSPHPSSSVLLPVHFAWTHTHGYMLVHVCVLIRRYTFRAQVQNDVFSTHCYLKDQCSCTGNFDKL